MRAEQPTPKKITVIQGKPIAEALRRAVRHALLEHKRAGNSIAVSRDGQVVLIPAEEIQVSVDADESDEI